MPYWLRSLAAGIHGRRLNQWRYGRETDAIVREALERDRWSPERLRQWQSERLAYILRRAATTVPYYRELWDARRRQGDLRSVEELQSWPILEKETVRQRGAELVADDCDRRRMRCERTSGSTGAPLTFWRSRRTLQHRFGVYLARHRNWYGVSREEPWALVGGQQIVHRERRSPPFWVWNSAMRQLYVSSYHLAPEQARESLRAIQSHGCRYLWGYSSSINALAQAALLYPEVAPSGLLFAMSTAEPLLPAQRSNIEQAFGCPARESYGQVELTAAAGECEAGSLHLFPEFGWLETVDENDQPLCDAPGQLIATSLLDEDMPLIRYRNGDRARLPNTEAACPCGRALPLLDGLEGRQDDILYSLDGRPVGRMDPVFKADLAIREAQIIQQPSRAIRVLVAPAPQYSSADEETLTREIRARLGDVPVRFELVERIPRTANGKFRAVIAEKSTNSPPSDGLRARAAPTAH